MAKCPHCDQSITSVNVEPITIYFGAKDFRGTSFSCPHCDAVFSVGPDHAAVRSDLVQAVVEALRQG